MDKTKNNSVYTSPEPAFKTMTTRKFKSIRHKSKILNQAAYFDQPHFLDKMERQIDELNKDLDLKMIHQATAHEMYIRHTIDKVDILSNSTKN